MGHDSLFDQVKSIISATLSGGARGPIQEKPALNALQVVLLLLCGALAAALIGLGRFLTGPELALSLFYLIPIILVTWLGGLWVGLIVSFLSFLSWLIADLQFKQEFSHWYVPFLNETLRLGVFVFLTFVLSFLRESLTHQIHLSLTDYLTGIPNRRAFYERANYELLRARRFQRQLTIAYMDLDNFKVINDRFGHFKGDELLCTVSDIIKSNCRTTDLIARLGGDEFVILFPETGLEAAQPVILRLCQNFDRAMRDNHWPVTVSGGVVAFSWAPSNVDLLINEADRLMYAAKSDGKNMFKYELVAANAANGNPGFSNPRER